MAPIISQGALGVEGFLRAYPGMGLRPIRDNHVE